MPGVTREAVQVLISRVASWESESATPQRIANTQSAPSVAITGTTISTREGLSMRQSDWCP